MKKWLSKLLEQRRTAKERKQRITQIMTILYGCESVRDCHYDEYKRKRGK